MLDDSQSRAALRDRPGTRTGTLAVVLLGIISTAATAADVVWLRSAQNPGEQLRVTGEILDYTGKSLRLQQTSGLVRDYPAEKVIRIESRWTEPHRQADAALQQGDYALAIDRYRRALQAETGARHAWVRRKILAQLVWAYRAAGQAEKAGDYFAALAASDPATPYLACIPLAWAASDTLPEQKALKWLEDSEPAAVVLLGASHLLATQRRADALAALARLQGDEDPRIAQLATAQRWRAEVFRADANQTDRWEATIEKMDEPIRAGPYFVLAQALARQGRWEQAAAAYLRVPILYRRHRRLAAQSLVFAGRSLEQLGKSGDAARLYQEVIDDFGDTPAAAEAETLLARLAGSDGKKDSPEDKREP